LVKSALQVLFSAQILLAECQEGISLAPKQPAPMVPKGSLLGHLAQHRVTLTSGQLNNEQFVSVVFSASTPLVTLAQKCQSDSIEFVS